MRDQEPLNPDSRLVPAAIADRLLERASHIDAARDGAMTVARLRSVAAEAGISPDAFDAALAELPGDAQPVSDRTRPQSYRRRARWAVAALALVAIGTFAVSRTVVPVARPPMMNEALLVRCLAPAEAAELIRPYLGLRENSAVLRNGSRVLHIHATAEQLQKIKAALDQHEAAATTCSAEPGSL